uniref:Uncharacterized protein n=1 Tax=Knipowitschia caucasica TaxID=637954 RepID=A0AAV2KHZ6_KNICA
MTTESSVQNFPAQWRQSQTPNANLSLHHHWDQSNGFEEEEGSSTSSLVLRRRFKEALRSNVIRPPLGSCSFFCLNGGQCVNSESCDCSLFQATGQRCQTVPNQGAEREMTCRSWGQFNYETFDGLYFRFSGRCSYTLLRDCEDSRLSVQVTSDLCCGTVRTPGSVYR